MTDLATLLRTLQPVLNAGVYVFASCADARQLPPFEQIVASMREPEGVSVLVTEATAKRAGLTPTFRCAWITLLVNSDLQAVGLTAAFAAALGRAGISCNVVAGLHHDHLFVPVDQAERAMAALHALQATPVSAP